jgi:NADH-quinone oxidoreductase subunit M
MPRLAAFFLFVALSSLGLPMLNGFVGEFLILLGTYQAHWNWAAWAATGVILSACYLLWSYQKVFYGDVTVEKNRTLPDISVRERAILVTMAVITLWMGIGSVFITGRTATASKSVIDQMDRPQRAEEAIRPSTPAPAAPSAAQKPTSLERLGTR